MPGPKSNALYLVLGLAVTATDSEVSRSYRRLALQYHPDRNPDGAEMFKTLSNAYAVLSDPEKRALYDATGVVSDGQGGAQDDVVSTAQRSAELESQVRTFFTNYAGSAEEKDDAVAGYKKCGGNFPKMVREYLLFDNGVNGEVERLKELVTHLIATGRLTETPLFTVSTTPEKIRKLKKSMARERREAEEALKEMGLDKSSAAGGDDDSLGALQVLMQQRQRQSHDALLADMEKRYCSPHKDRRDKTASAGKKRTRSPSGGDAEKRRKKEKR